METKNTFRCKACKNSCEIQRILIRGRVYPFGGSCSKYKLLRQESSKIKEGQDLVETRNKLMLERSRSIPLKNPRGTIGIPMALTLHILLPLYTKFFESHNYSYMLYI
ncbi:hypothetical protein ES703_79834 [subsurface metagenome]